MGLFSLFILLFNVFVILLSLWSIFECFGWLSFLFVIFTITKDVSFYQIQSVRPSRHLSAFLIILWFQGFGFTHASSVTVWYQRFRIRITPLPHDRKLARLAHILMGVSKSKTMKSLQDKGRGHSSLSSGLSPSCPVIFCPEHRETHRATNKRQNQRPTWPGPRQQNPNPVRAGSGQGPELTTWRMRRWYGQWWNLWSGGGFTEEHTGKREELNLALSLNIKISYPL